MTRALHERVRLMRQRQLIRSWEYRQRHHAKGAWFRLRRVLVDAAEVWLIDDADADDLETAGHVPEGVGTEFAPSKRLFFVSSETLAELSTRRRVPVRLNAQVLEARNLALVAHSDSGPISIAG